MEKQKRSIGADIIRCFALFLVVSVHFFFHNGYYKQVMVVALGHWNTPCSMRF